ncbi:MAG: excinuclease ABC subunit UvrC [Clostridiales bacterium]|nr:excinuclease ABC subunit UvrC [Clostridiales bacterium]
MIAVFDIQEELKALPASPGVYIMRDENEHIIYVGKAVNLKNRVRQYFQESANHSPKTVNMVRRIRSFNYIVTSSELEALILECNMIKENRPKYNILLKDDKAYPYIKMTLDEDFPRLIKTRRRDRDGARYFGPYASGTAVAEVLALALSIWPLRRCRKHISKSAANADRPCLYHQMGLCRAPCAGLITAEEYGAAAAEALAFVGGKRDRVLRDLKEKMAVASETLEYEKAAERRDQIAAIQALTEGQSVTRGGDDADVLALARAGDEALVEVFFIRAGKMTGDDHFILTGVSGMPRGEALGGFITQFYSGTPYIPKEILTECEVADKAVVADWLSGLRGHKVTITSPKRGDKLKLVETAGRNALITLERRGEDMLRERRRTTGAVAEIMAALGLPAEAGERIEAYDISNTAGYESVASMVVFEGGRPARSEYRKFRIKTVVGADDYASMEEVITRRLARYVRELGEVGSGRFSKLPGVVFMDGGKGQVSAAERAMEAVGVSLPVCGMVKDDSHSTRGVIYNGAEIALPRSSEGFKLLTRIQDEVHRFAVEYHRKLRAAAQVRSVLDGISGVGPKRRLALMKKFGSIEAIRAADESALADTPGMNAASARAVYEFFRK